MKILAFVARLILLVSNSEAFLPNHLSFSEDTANDFTHDDITKTAALRVVARLLEDEPRNGSTIVPGSLVNMTDLTAQNIFDAYYGEGVSAENLDQAIDQIVKANNNVDLTHPDDAAYHFEGGKIIEGNNILLNTRRKMEDMIENTETDYDAVREATGQYLHTLQMFYSNTNWIELKGQVVYEALGAQNASLMPVARGSKDPCDYDLVPDDQVLISSFRVGKFKANGHGKEKCKGGINKETSNPEVSPHYTLHQEAGETAILASEALIDSQGSGLRQKYGNEVIKSLFNVGGGHSLVLVVDITGSMADEIVAVQQMCKEIVIGTAASANAPFNYILSTFGDPETQGGIQVTKDSNKFLDYIDAITIDGGGDCPEFIMLGIERGLQAALPGSDVYIFTDADAKDAERKPSISSLAADKKCHFQFLITGSCASSVLRRKRDLVFQQKLIGKIDPIYELLAKETGGEVIITEKSTISTAVKVIAKNIVVKGSLVLLLKISVNESLREITVPVDDTLNEMTIQIVGRLAEKIRATLYKPDGSLAVFGTSQVKLDADIDGLMMVHVTNVTAGDWKIRFDGNQTYDVEVTGISPFDFKYQFVQEMSSGLTYPITGDPIAGETAIIVVETIGKTHIQSVGGLIVSDVPGRQLQIVPLKSGTGKASNLHKGTFQLPKEGIRLSLTGKDKKGGDFIRTKATPVTPSYVTLKLLKADTDFLIPGGNLTVPFVVKNFGNDGNFDVNVKNEELRQSVTSINFTLPKGQESQDEVTFYADESMQPGLTSTAIFSVSGSTGSLLNSVIKRLVVTEPPIVPDLTSPLCRTRIMENNCNTSRFCEKSRWEVSLLVQDTDSGIQTLILRHIGPNATISEPPYELGTTSEIKANYSSTCCSDLMTIAAVDVAGNEVHCKENITVPVEPPPLPPPPPAVHFETWKIALIVVVVVVAIILTMLLLIYALKKNKSHGSFNLPKPFVKYATVKQRDGAIRFSLGEDTPEKV